MELKNYSFFLISVFTINLLISCSPPELVKPVEATQTVKSEVKEASSFTVRLVNPDTYVSTEKATFEFTNGSEKESYLLKMQLETGESYHYISEEMVVKLKKKEAITFTLDCPLVRAYDRFYLEVTLQDGEKARYLIK